MGTFGENLLGPQSLGTAFASREALVQPPGGLLSLVL